VPLLSRSLSSTSQKKLREKKKNAERETKDVKKRENFFSFLVQNKEKKDIFRFFFCQTREEGFFYLIQIALKGRSLLPQSSSSS
jgi:hypothetical protein